MAEFKKMYFSETNLEEHSDAYLMANGWKRYDQRIGDPCPDDEDEEFNKQCTYVQSDDYMDIDGDDEWESELEVSDEIVKLFQDILNQEIQKEDENYEDVLAEDVSEVLLSEEVLNEFLFKKMVVRGGKKIKKWFSSIPGFKVVKNPDNPNAKPKLVKVKSKEKIARKKGAKRAKVKKVAKKFMTAFKRKKSLKKRSMFGLK